MKTARNQRGITTGTTHKTSITTKTNGTGKFRSDRSDSSMSRKSKTRRPNQSNYMYDPRRQASRTRHNSKYRLNPLRHSMHANTNRAPTQSKSGRITNKMNTSLPDNYVYAPKGQHGGMNVNSIEQKLKTLENRVNTVIKGSEGEPVLPKVNPFKQAKGPPAIDDLIPYKPPAQTEPGFYQRKHRQSEPAARTPTEIKIPKNEMTNACAVMIQKIWRGY